MASDDNSREDTASRGLDQVRSLPPEHHQSSIRAQPERSQSAILAPILGRQTLLLPLHCPLRAWTRTCTTSARSAKATAPQRAQQQEQEQEQQEQQPSVPHAHTG